MASSLQSPPKLRSCQTTTKTYKLNFEWKLDRLSLSVDEASTIRSSVFLEEYTNTKWYASLSFVRRYNFATLHLITGSISHLSRGALTAYVNYYLSDPTRNAEIQSGTCQPQQIYSYGCELFTVDRDSLFPQAKFPRYGEEILLRFEINILSHRVTDPPFYHCVPSSVTKCSLVQDFDALLKNQKYCDVVLSVDGKEFHAHKAILCARSAVFAAMFECEMSEANDNKVTIEDVKGDVFSELLRFIYTGEVGNLDGVAYDLLSAADKYSLMELKAICEQKLYSTLSKDNAIEILLLADKHYAITLKAESLSFLAANSSVIFDASVWKRFLSEHPHLANDILLKRLVKPK